MRGADAGEDERDQETHREMEEALARGQGPYELRLYVTGATPRSGNAVASVKAICEEHLPGQYVLEVVDLYQQPHLAEGDHILATPTLIKLQPPPLRRLVGDLSDEERVLSALDLKPRTSAASAAPAASAEPAAKP
ncbi:MAG TPA: circadian clock KaiB family protein [Thermoanaerobaculia bacterium]|nr:circadian clock KaiB family protein [Thermoanaerobaculia bacterium]